MSVSLSPFVFSEIVFSNSPIIFFNFAFSSSLLSILFLHSTSFFSASCLSFKFFSLSSCPNKGSNFSCALIISSKLDIFFNKPLKDGSFSLTSSFKLFNCSLSILVFSSLILLLLSLRTSSFFFTSWLASSIFLSITSFSISLSLLISSDGLLFNILSISSFFFSSASISFFSFSIPSTISSFLSCNLRTSCILSLAGLRPIKAHNSIILCLNIFKSFKYNSSSSPKTSPKYGRKPGYVFSNSSEFLTPYTF